MPKFSIITVNYNDVSGLQKTVESVVTQTHTNFEYIVIDGASQDGSAAYIEKNQHFFAHWISEKDKGVYEAMNKGLRWAKGEYVLFLNSGDFFINESVLEKVARKVDDSKAIYYGNLVFRSAKKEFIRTYPKQLEFSYFLKRSLPHPGTFIRRTLFDALFYYSEDYKIISDWEFFIYAICKANVSYQHLEETISVFNLQGMSNNPKNKALIEAEKAKVYQRYFQKEYREAVTHFAANNEKKTKKATGLKQLLRSVFQKKA